MPLVIALSGFHSTGKTTLGTYLVSALRKRGYRIAVLKSTREEGPLTDRVGSDTWRYRTSGAEAVGLLQRELLTLFIDTSDLEKEELFSLILKFFEDYDLILLEGFKSWEKIPKIWVLGELDNEKEILRQYKNIELFVTMEDREKVVEFVLNKLKRTSDKV